MQIVVGDSKNMPGSEIAGSGFSRRAAHVVAAVAWLGLLPVAAHGQVTGSLPRSSEWSGQSGASGHPEMTAEAIRAAAAGFRSCVAGMAGDAARRGVGRAAYERITAGLTPDLKIMDFMDSQPEFTRSFWDYLDMLVSDTRIERGRAMMAQHRAAFDAAERNTGVDRYVVAAIWGIESNFGTTAGDRPVIRSTATLACVGRRQAYFMDEFLAAVEIVARGDISAERFRGSWAGAFGQTQFMPTTFKRHAVDADGDGRRDVIGSVADAIASTSNNLHKAGWQPGQTWGYEVVVPSDFDFRLADRKTRLSVHDWQRRGIHRVAKRAFPRGSESGYMLVPAGIQGPGFLMLNNFRVIMSYNPSEAYALAIGHLADRMRGGGPFVQDWPRYERVLSRQDRLEMQQHLARHGFDVGEPDGRLGSRTREAIRDFQRRAGQVPDGFASASVLDQLRGR